MKTISRIALCILFSLILTSCERYENLNEQFTDIYGTWKNPDSFDGNGIIDVKLLEDKLIIVESSDKKLLGKFPNKLSKFADYQSFKKDGELLNSGEVYIKEQYDDGMVIFFTNSGSLSLVTIKLLIANEMEIITGSGTRYRFVQ